MPIRHYVLFELAEDLPDADRAADELVDGLRGLGDRIDLVSNLAVGRDLSGRSEFAVGFSCDLDSRTDLDAYLAHDAHREAVETLIRPRCRRWAVVDIELARGRDQSPSG